MEPFNWSAPWDDDEDSPSGLNPTPEPSFQASGGPVDWSHPWEGPEFLTPFDKLERERARLVGEQLRSIGVDPARAAMMSDAGLLGMTRLHQIEGGAEQYKAIMEGLEQPEQAAPMTGPRGGIGDILRQIPAGLVEGASNVAFGVPQGWLRMMSESLRGRLDDGTAWEGYEPVQQWAEQWADAYGAAQQAYSAEAQGIAPPPENLVGKAARAAGPSAGIMAPFALGPEVGVPAAYTQIFADDINRTYAAGEDIDQRKLATASLSAAAQSLIEVAGGAERALSAGIQAAGGLKPFLLNLAKNGIVGEGLEEGAQSAVDVLGRAAAGEFEGENPVEVAKRWIVGDRDTGEPGVLEEMAIGAILGGFMTAAVTGPAELQAANRREAFDRESGAAADQIDQFTKDALAAAYAEEGGDLAPSETVVAPEAVAVEPELGPAPAVEDSPLALADEPINWAAPWDETAEEGAGPTIYPPMGVPSPSPEVAAQAPPQAADAPVQGQAEMFPEAPAAEAAPPITLEDFRGRLLAAGRPQEEVDKAVGLIERFAARRGESPNAFLGRAVSDVRAGLSQEEIGGDRAFEEDGTLERAAYHGSPEEFGRFDMGRVSPGQGSQAFGHGLYFSSRKDVADFFKGRPREEGSAPGSPRTYSVDLKVQDDEWLDWSTPFDQQSPKVQEGVREAFRGIGLPAEGEAFLSKGPSGEAIYSVLSENLGSPTEASSVLLEAGVRGNRFRDPNARFIAEGAEASHNYVLFSDSDVEIESFERRAGRKVHGRVRFDPDNDGKAFIQIARGADAKAVSEELIHTFRQHLPSEDLAEATRLLRVRDPNKWTRAEEELFAKKTLLALDGQETEGVWQRIAQLFREWMESAREWMGGNLREEAVGRGFRKFVDRYLGTPDSYPATAPSLASGEQAEPTGRRETDLERTTSRQVRRGPPRDGARGFLKKWFNSEGVFSSTAFEAIETATQKKQADYLAALGESRALLQVIDEKVPEDGQHAALAAVTSYMGTSDETHLESLPRPAQFLAKRMRAKIDSLSRKIAERPGMVTDTLADVILGEAKLKSDGTGLGSYWTRTFRAFQSDDWHDEIKDSPLWHALKDPIRKLLIADAEASLRAQYGKRQGRKEYLTEEQIQEAMDYIVAGTTELKDGGFVTPPLAHGEKADRFHYLKERIDRHRRTVSDVEGTMDNVLLEAKRRFRGPHGSEVGTILTGIYQQRKKLPDEIRQLLGEDVNPAIRYLHTIEALTRNLATHEMYSALLSNGLEEGWASTSPREGYLRFKGSGTRNPLAGTDDLPIYIHHEIDKALTERETTGEADVIRTVAGLVKMGLTVLSPQTQARNILSNVVFMLGAGALTSPKYLRAAGAVLWKGVSGRKAGGSKEALSAAERLREDMFVGASDEVIHGALVKMRELGVTGTSVDVRDVHYFLDWMADDLDPENLNVSTKADRAVLALKKASKAAVNLYQLGDDMFKVARYLQEMARLQYHSPELVKNDLAKAERTAAKVVKDTMPNYDRLSKAMRALKRNRLFGPFISFAAEVPRVTMNQFLQAGFEIREGMASGNHKMVSTGVHRMSSQAFAISVLPTLVAGITKALFGMDDDDQTAEDKNAMRALLPPWMKNGQPIFLRRGDGSFFVLDWGFMDPYAVWKRPAYALMREGVLGFVTELSDVYLGEELIVAPGIDIIRNRKRSGGQVFPEGGSTIANLAIAAQHFSKSALPGFAKTLDRIVRAGAGVKTDWGRSYDLWAELTAVVGPRVMKIDAKDALGWEARAYLRRIRGASEGVRRGTPKEGEEVPEGPIRGALAGLVHGADNVMRLSHAASGQAAYYTAARDLSQAIAGARAAGVSDKDVVDALKSARLPSDDLRAALRSAEDLVEAAQARSVRRRRSLGRSMGRRR